MEASNVALCVLLPREVGNVDTLHRVCAATAGRGERRIHYASTARRGERGSIKVHWKLASSKPRLGSQVTLATKKKKDKAA